MPHWRDFSSTVFLASCVNVEPMQTGSPQEIGTSAEYLFGTTISSAEETGTLSDPSNGCRLPRLSALVSVSFSSSVSFAAASVNEYNLDITPTTVLHR
jgi:hypothetical protein